MRVLINTKPLVFPNKSGISYYVFNLYSELIRSGIDIIPTLDNKSSSLLSSLSRVSCRLRAYFGKMYPSFVINIGDAMIGFLSERNTDTPIYDLYHETSFDPIPEIKAKSIFTLYDVAVFRHPEFFTDYFAKYTTSNIMKNIATAHRIIVNTQFTKKEAMELLNIPDEKIDIIPLAPSSICRITDNSASDLCNIKKFTEKDYILYVGTVEPRKNLKTLIRAFRDIKTKYDITLIIAGGFGWLYDDIVSYPEDLKIKEDVIFTGYVDEETLFSLYRHALALVYPSLYEGFGIPPLEAMACGTPVIISDIPSLTEVAGDAAMVFNPKDHDELAAVIGNVLSSESLRTELSRKGLQKANGYSWGNVAGLTIQTYRKALGN